MNDTLKENEIYYAVPDLHGRADLLAGFLAYITAQHPDGCTVVFLGDYINRGPESRKVVDMLMHPPTGFTFICLRGNHEAMFLTSVKYPARVFEYRTWDQFLEKRQHPKGLPYFAVPETIVDWMRALRLFHRIDDNIFAHSIYDARVPPDRQQESHLLWDIFDDPDEVWDPGEEHLFLVRGHQTVPDGPHIHHNTRLDLDCGAIDGRLVVGVFRKGQRGPVGFLQQEGA